MQQTASSKELDPNPQSWPLPVLAGVIKQPGRIHFVGIRGLTSQEQEDLKAHTAIATAAQDRFKLFTILKRNYAEWHSLISSLLAPGEDLNVDQHLELDRRLMNFFSSAKALLDHFKRDWIQRYRNSEKQDKFGEFITKLEETSWAFAFFQDLRNFTQHCGLPVGKYSRSTTSSEVKLHVFADSKWLVENYTKWNKSHLTEDKGNLDLIELSKEYYLYLMRDFGNFVAHDHAPQLLAAHKFLGSLDNEVKEKHSKAQLAIITELDHAGLNRNYSYLAPPGDLLNSIGIVVREKEGANGQAS